MLNNFVVQGDEKKLKNKEKKPKTASSTPK